MLEHYIQCNQIDGGIFGKMAGNRPGSPRLAERMPHGEMIISN
jgi:hypothetical protein